MPGHNKAPQQPVRSAADQQLGHELSASGSSATPSGSVTVKYKSSGPHYDPILVQQYEKIKPGLGVSIVENSLAQSSHRMKMEERQQIANINQSKIGQITGAAFGILGLAIGTYLAVSGYEAASSTVFGTTVLGLASIFVIGRTKQSTERKKKNSDMAEILGMLLTANTASQSSESDENPESKGGAGSIVD
jgi:uncharacterized membrane protein